MVRYAVIHSRSFENAGVVGSAGNSVNDGVAAPDEDMMIGKANVETSYREQRRKKKRRKNIVRSM